MVLRLSYGVAASSRRSRAGNQIIAAEFRRSEIIFSPVVWTGYHFRDVTKMIKIQI